MVEPCSHFCVRSCLCAPIVRAGDKQPNAERGRARPVAHALLQNLNLVVRLVGQKERPSKSKDFVKARSQEPAFEGVDPARPLALYVRFGKSLPKSMAPFSSHRR